MTEFKKTDRTTITRLPKRGTYDKDTIYAILDEALYCTVAYVHEDSPMQIPTGFCRIGDKLYIHGSVGSFYMRQLADQKPQTCISVTLMDGLVLARSAFHHSVNYRSVSVFGVPEKVTDEGELYNVLEVFTNKMQPGRWSDIRKPTPAEWRATMVLSFMLQEVSGKTRSGGPKDDAEDYDLHIWAGVVPLQLKRLAAIPDPALQIDIRLPEYLKIVT